MVSLYIREIRWAQTHKAEFQQQFSIPNLNRNGSEKVNSFRRESQRPRLPDLLH